MVGGALAGCSRCSFMLLALKLLLLMLGARRQQVPLVWHLQPLAAGSWAG
jgi:hypothetical protein